MGSRIRTRKKSTREHTPQYSTAPAGGMFQSRPMQVRSQQAEKSQQQQDLKTSLLRTLRYGHHLYKMHPAGVSAAPAVQQKKGMGQPEQTDKAKAPQVLQAKLTVGAPGDMYEQAVDRISTQVVSRLNAPALGRSALNKAGMSTEVESSKRGAESGRVGIPLQAKLTIGEVRNSSLKATPQTEDASNKAIRQLAQEGIQTSSSELPYAEQIQKSFGRHDISRIQAHLGQGATASARSMNASAYATGDDVVFAGRPDIHTAAHEAAHVVQQRGSVQLAGGIGNEGDIYEQHADAVADRVTAGQSAEELLNRFAVEREGLGEDAMRHSVENTSPPKENPTRGRTSEPPTSAIQCLQDQSRTPPQVNIAKLNQADCDRYLEIALSESQDEKVTIESGDIKKLLQRKEALARSKREDREHIRERVPAKKRYDEARQSIDQLLTDWEALKNDNRFPGMAEEAKKIHDDFVKNAEQVQVRAEKLTLASGNLSEAYEMYTKFWNQKSDILEKGIAEIKRIGKSAGLPSPDRETVQDFSTLETWKQEARDLRKPIEEVLQKYAEEVDNIIPGAKLVYRGSLTRGVKSPSKYKSSGSGPALAKFNDAYKTTKKFDSQHQGKDEPQPNYDIDANIEIPDREFNKLKAKGMRTGPLALNPSNLPEVSKLKQLESKLVQEINAKRAQLPGIDRDDPISLFISTTSRAQTQMKQGNPYPPFMLENAGLSSLAAHLPSFYSKELEQKVTEYMQRLTKGTGGKKLPPLQRWEPFFAQLYEHIKKEGPKAVSLPEVSVEVLKDKPEILEKSELPQPPSDANYTKPVDLAKEQGYTFS